MTSTTTPATGIPNFAAAGFVTPPHHQNRPSAPVFALETSGAPLEINVDKYLDALFQSLPTWYHGPIRKITLDLSELKASLRLLSLTLLEFSIETFIPRSIMFKTTLEPIKELKNDPEIKKLQEQFNACKETFLQEGKQLFRQNKELERKHLQRKLLEVMIEGMTSTGTVHSIGLKTIQAGNDTINPDSNLLLACHAIGKWISIDSNLSTTETYTGLTKPEIQTAFLTLLKKNIPQVTSDEAVTEHPEHLLVTTVLYLGTRFHVHRPESYGIVNELLKFLTVNFNAISFGFAHHVNGIIILKQVEFNQKAHFVKNATNTTTQKVRDAIENVKDDGLDSNTFKSFLKTFFKNEFKKAADQARKTPALTPTAKNSGGGRKAGQSSDPKKGNNSNKNQPRKDTTNASPAKRNNEKGKGKGNRPTPTGNGKGTHADKNKKRKANDKKGGTGNNKKKVSFTPPNKKRKQK
jgi:hypothetical protein